MKIHVMYVWGYKIYKTAQVVTLTTIEKQARYDTTYK